MDHPVQQTDVRLLAVGAANFVNHGFVCNFLFWYHKYFVYFSVCAEYDLYVV